MIWDAYTMDVLFLAYAASRFNWDCIGWDTPTEIDDLVHGLHMLWRDDEDYQLHQYHLFGDLLQQIGA